MVDFMETLFIPPAPKIVEGNLLDQPVEVIVNAWNRNIIPWWLLWPQGVSAAIKKKAGLQPFIELGTTGPLPLGHAVMTSAGRLPYKAIIHVAGINMAWFATEESIRTSVRSAMALAQKHRYKSIALPTIGAGTGGIGENRSLLWTMETLAELASPLDVIVVRYRKPSTNQESATRV